MSLTIIQQIERDQISAVTNKRIVPEFAPGDTVKVMVKVFEGLEGNAFPPDAAVGTVTFEERDGHTTVVSTFRYPSKEVRDLVVESGMEEGAAVSYDRLEELLATLSAA